MQNIFFGFVRRLKKQSIQFNEDIRYKEQVVYKEKSLITLQGKAAIYYTTDGSIPDSFQPESTEPDNDR